MSEIKWNSTRELPTKSGRYWVVPEWVLNPNQYDSTESMLTSRLEFAAVEFDLKEQKFFVYYAEGHKTEVKAAYWAEILNITIEDFIDETEVEIEI